jgi:putative spermidine/putrescine transport system substrate-binding protein
MNRRHLLGLLAAVSPSCTRPAVPALTAGALAHLPWSDVEQRAAGSTVYFGMWAGDEARNRFFQESVAEVLQRRYGVTLRVVPATDTAELVNKLRNEKRAGRVSGGSIDVLWINGENFRTAKQAGLLWGPFAERLPNVRLYNPISLRRDFGMAIEGWEAPWQTSAFVLAHDMAHVPAPPRTLDALRQWIEAHPGRFTYVAPPDFTGSAFIRHFLIHFGGGAAGFETFDESLYQRASTKALEILNGMKPYLWRRGETYPSTQQELQRMFANREVDFCMSYSPSFASAAMARGELPSTVRTFVLESGTLGNYNYLAIPFNASNPYGALTFINHVMSFAHMLEQSRRLGTPSPHDPARLTEEERKALQAIDRGPATLSDGELAAHFLPEPDAQYLDRFEKDWLTKVLQR